MNQLEKDIVEGRARMGPNGEAYTVTSWAMVDLDPVKRGERTSPAPEFLKRSDGRALIYPGRPHVFFGQSESLKTWAAVLACKSFLDSGLTALYIDFESDETTFVDRARNVGVPDGAIGRSLQYIRPDEPLKDNANALADLVVAETELRPSLVVLDGVTEAYALHGWDINKATDAAEFQRLFGSFAEGTASIAIDHAGKDASRGVIGSQHKRAGLNGAEYEFTPVRREGRGGHSIASIKVTKDRHGYIREWAPTGVIGKLHVSPDGTYIEAPSSVETSVKDKTQTMETALLGWMRANPGQPTKAVKDGVPGRAQDKTNALRTLEVDGKVRQEPGPHSSKLWYPAE